MRQAAMEDGVSAMLSSVVGDVGQAVHRNVHGAQLLHELLSAPWLHALLKIYECLMQFQRLTPSPILPYASGLSHEIISTVQKIHRPSAEARELYSLLDSPHIQALLSSHDIVAQLDYGPVLPPLPDEMPDDEEAMRIVCLVKNNQPLSREVCGGFVGDGAGLIPCRWNSLRRLTLERLVPERRARSGEELRVTDSETSPLPLHRGESRPFLPHYESTGSSRLCPQTTDLSKTGLNQSAPSVFSPIPCNGSFSDKHIWGQSASSGGCSDDYAYPPPPVPAYGLSLPNSPVFYRKGATGGHSRNIATPGRTSSGAGRTPLRAHTTPSSPAAHPSTRQQGVSTLPTPGRQHWSQPGSQNKHQDALLSHPSMIHFSTAPHRNECQNQSQPIPCHPPDLTKQHSVEELRSSIKHGTQDVCHLGQKVMAANEMITDSMEENAQALDLLAHVVDKLQGLIVASKHPVSSPPHRPKEHTPPPPPPRVSSISPKVVRKPPTPYPHHLLSSSSSSCSSSSSSSSVSYRADGFTTSNPMNRGSNRTVVSISTAHRAGGGGSNRQVRLNNGSVSRAPVEDQQDCNSTGCLTTKRKKKKK
ncbi:uncharacterized protein LOC115587431 isoform X4 [Sparus aurata]|uniref:uncharacterized protein LOC115587431 isoform X4 n=1 Tax=Sparus aurata TaxID=8175 RepID=UPI0011C0F8C9|nr:uncharacterized protein LOC115587431 isoform X4 [Sparus aurata]